MPLLLDVHRTGAEDSLYEYYDREVADMVSYIYAEDFVRFGYPIWKGPPDMIHLT